MTQEFPRLKYFDLDLVSFYTKLWSHSEDYWSTVQIKDEEIAIFHNPKADTIRQIDAITSTFFLVYSNRIFSAYQQLDYFYNRQEEDGAIRGEYRISDNTPVKHKNSYRVGAPLFSWAEYNMYHRLDGKKRLREVVVPTLEKYYQWINACFQKPNGLYMLPISSTDMTNRPNSQAKYLVDFNMQMAVFCYYMGQIGSILNDKDVGFRYNKFYFSLKNRINSKMWDERTQWYYDLDSKENHVRIKSICAYWALLARIPNETRTTALLSQLEDPKGFGTANPFPTLAVSERNFSKNGDGYRGSVFPLYTFVVIKGLEHCGRHAEARKYTLQHLYAILELIREEKDFLQGLCEAYKPHVSKPAQWDRNRPFPQRGSIGAVALVGITLFIEVIIGIDVSLPRKTLQINIPSLELLGIENFLLKRNHISICCQKRSRGWEIQLSSEKLYYFTINIKSKPKKTLPIPAGSCAILVDKI